MMSDNMKKLYRSRSDRLLAGVCAGLGEYLGIDATIVRLVFVLSVFLTFTTSLFVYLVFWFVIPEEPVLTVVDGQVVDRSDT
ncbi:MAG TPA: PspC domain-containing protein [Anaerolinea sp.]|nr:PspC domain-containing protein [Anaerolinea sp.]